MIRYIVGWIAITVLLWLFVMKCDFDIPSDIKKINKKTLLYVFFAAIIFIFLGIFKDFLANPSLDTYAYYMNFQDANTGFINFLTNSKFEIGYTVVIWLFKNVINNFYITMGCFYALIFCMNIYFLKYIKWNKYSPLLLGLYTLQMFSSYYILRSYLSICIALVTIILIYKKEYIKSFLVILLAVSFHNSALILLPVLFLNVLFEKYLDFDEKHIIGVTLISVICTFFALQFVKIYMSTSEKYSYYLQQGSISVGVMAFWLVIIIYCLIEFKNIIKMSSINKTLIITTFAHCIVVPLQQLYSIMYRMNLFFIPIELCLAVQLLNMKDYKSKKEKYILLAFIALYTIYKIYTFFHSEIIYII